MFEKLIKFIKTRGNIILTEVDRKKDLLKGKLFGKSFFYFAKVISPGQKKMNEF